MSINLVEKVIYEQFEQICLNVEKVIYEQFEEICLHGTEYEIETYLKKYNVDINHDDGYFIETICLRNDLKLLKMIVRNGANVYSNDCSALRIVAHRGYIELLNYLLYDCGMNCDILFESTACSNNKNTVNILNEYISKRDKIAC